MITEGHLARHYSGRSGGRGPALVDVAQDHALKIIADAGIFDLGVVFKGGTALRKFRAGNAGRFSTDLDFAAAPEPAAQLLLETLDGASLEGFRFRVESINGVRRSLLRIDSVLGTPGIDARIDCSPRTNWVPAERLSPIPFPIHLRYGFEPAAVPVMALEEVLAEKLARYRRANLARDLYDLAWAAAGPPFDDVLVRRMLVLKVWHDVVEDGLGTRPFDAADILDDRSPDDFAPEDIGLLTRPVDLPGWIELVRTRFAFVADLDDEERAVARCSPGDAYRVAQMAAALGR